MVWDTACGQPCLLYLFSVTYGMIYNSVQANTISLALNSAFGFDRAVMGIILAIASVAIICGGLGRIARVTEWMVPLMAGVYILVALGIMIYHIDLLPHVFAEILEDAFSFQAAAGGGMGAAVLTGFKKRSVLERSRRRFCSECGSYR